MQTFTDLVGTSAAVPAHCFDIEELTNLTPALDTATVVDGLAAQASEAMPTSDFLSDFRPHTSAPCTLPFCPFDWQSGC